MPEEPWEQFQGVNHISTFVRSGVTTAYELATKGWIDFDTTTSDQLRAAANESCHPSGKPPNIIMVLDEASFDASAVPGIKLPPGYGGHFQSWDGKKRSLIVEGSGGPTWYTEYNVLTGLSARSYGRLSYYVTRIAAGRVNRGLPQALRRCGYKTISLYPAYGAFLSAQEIPGDHRRQPLPQLRRHEGRGLRARSLLLRSGAADHPEREGRSAAVHFRIHHVQPLSLVEHSSGPS